MNSLHKEGELNNCMEYLKMEENLIKGQKYKELTYQIYINNISHRYAFTHHPWGKVENIIFKILNNSEIHLNPSTINNCLSNQKFDKSKAINNGETTFIFDYKDRIMRDTMKRMGAYQYNNY